VKVQRPNLYFLIRRDVVILRFLGTFLSPLLPLNIGVGIGEIIDEFGKALFDEIDYQKEAENALKFANLFKENPNIFIPKLEKQFSSKRVITTSWIDGVKLRDRFLLEENKIDRGETLKNMAIIYMSNGEEDLAIETYEKALLENPKQPSCLKNIGLIYEKRGRYAEQSGDLDQRDIWFDKAAEVWSKAVRLYPGGYLDIENWLKNSGRSSIDMYL